MNRFMRKRKARGFTLVELLIVIVIIGILAGSMLLVFGSATDKAKATKIVSNLRSLKAASLMAYSDFNTWPTEIASLDDYMDRPIPDTTDDLAVYSVETSGDSAVYLKAALQTAAGTSVQEKLAEIAAESGLYQDMSDNVYSSGTDVFVSLTR